MLCSATVPPDDFIANCKFPLSDLIGKAEQPLHEIWVDLEPNGKLHVKIELLWATQDEQNQPNRAFQVNSLTDTQTIKDPNLISDWALRYQQSKSLCWKSSWFQCETFRFSSGHWLFIPPKFNLNCVKSTCKLSEKWGLEIVRDYGRIIHCLWCKQWHRNDKGDSYLRLAIFTIIV